VQLWLAGLPPQTKRRVRAALKGLVASARDIDLKALRRELEGFYRLRIGDHRIVYHLETKQTIRLDYVDLREEVYEAFRRLRALREPQERESSSSPKTQRPRKHL
jgi:mRNA-degrading endonuclease RelE of RelBE toxin-antitoxin system